MFAILFHEDMQKFYDIVTSFPTVIFSFFLFMSMLFWAASMLGLVDLDFLDLDLGVEPDAADPTGSVKGSDPTMHDSLSTANILGGILLRLGLDGIPLTIIISLVSLVGWFVSFNIGYFFLEYLPFTWLKWLLGIPVFLVVLYASAWLTGRMTRPFKKFFQELNQLPAHKRVLGQVATVNTLEVTPSFGEVKLEDGGAGLILKARCSEENTGKFKRGDKVVLLEYMESENAYRIISEMEFNN